MSGSSSCRPPSVQMTVERIGEHSARAAFDYDKSLEWASKYNVGTYYVRWTVSIDEFVGGGQLDSQNSSRCTLEI